MSVSRLTHRALNQRAKAGLLELLSLQPIC